MSTEPTPTPPDLSAVPIDVLSREIARREIAGECVALIVTPSDLAEYWECDDAGNTHPGSDEPDARAMAYIRKAFEWHLDGGTYSEIMHACRDAWNDAKAEGVSTPPPPPPWNGIDENTRDPLESDDDAPDVPSELDEMLETKKGVSSYLEIPVNDEQEASDEETEEGK